MNRGWNHGALALALVVHGCGGGGSSGSSAVSTGEFVDSAVHGVEYTAGSMTGVTSASGGFEYRGGATVEFRVGDIILGQATAAPRLTPVQLVAGATDETNPTVTNIARFLQTLDSDGDPANGLKVQPKVLAAAVGQTMNFAQSTADFGADPNVAAVLAALNVGPLVSAAAAQNHLRSTLLRLIGGRYSGRYGGSDTGSWACFIDDSGTLLGCGFSNQDQDVFLFDGMVTSDGSGLFGTTDDSADFQGTFGAGSVSGTWSNSMFGDQGTFSGVQRQNLASALDPTIVAQLVGTYSGTFTLAGPPEAGSITVAPDGSLSFSLPGAVVSASLLDTAAGGATLEGITDDGVLIMGMFDTVGNVSGSLDDLHSNDLGTFSATRP